MTPSDRHENVLKILFLAAEADPFIKVGGLGDVAGSLPRFLRRLSPDQAQGYRLDVRLVIPLHAAIQREKFDLQAAGQFPVPTQRGPVTAEVYRTEIDGLPAYLIAGPYIPSEGPIYSRDTQADGTKFAFFSLAALELARYFKWKPDIIHANDWHTALAVYMLRTYRQEDAFFAGTKSVLGVHNLPFMGVGTEAALEEFGIQPAQDEGLPVWAQRLPLPMGLAAADRIIPVSPGYAQEILTPEFGCNLQNFLITRRDIILGILNGLDTVAWDPHTDPFLTFPYSAEQMQFRSQNKEALQRDFQLLPSPRTPLIAMIGRMDTQKGVDLALEGLRQKTDLPWQAIILGTGDPLLEQASQQLANNFPERIRAVIRFDNQLSHRLYAGADLLLMPSRYEPCGLAQMIAMRYGCVPLARATGGLKDTIVSHTPRAVGTGFLFDQATAAAFSQAFQKALNVYRRPTNWQSIQRNGMSQDFSWERSAIAYAGSYLDLKGR